MVYGQLVFQESLSLTFTIYVPLGGLGCSSMTSLLLLTVLHITKQSPGEKSVWNTTLWCSTLTSLKLFFLNMYVSLIM